MGAIREVACMDRPQAIAQAFAAFKSQGRESLVVCATHDEIDRVTEAIRSARKAAGELTGSIQLTRDVSLNWTTAQKSDMRNLHPSQLLGFHRAVKGIARNETVEVVDADGATATVRNDRGELQNITAKQARCFDVYERRGIEVAAGDKLLLTANRREPGFRATNGKIATVASVDHNGHIRLKDGRIVPGNFKQFTHGNRHRNSNESLGRACIRDSIEA